jgi:c-di-GMP-binding flagellar brake protein YcgR
MTQSSAAANPFECIREGERCLLSADDQRYMVEIVQVDDESFRVTFPTIDYPVDGMQVDIEFHDPAGFYYCRTEVLRGPQKQGDGVMLQKPCQMFRSVHRESCRVAAEIPAKVRDQVHVTKSDAVVEDLSAGGARVRTDAPLDMDATIELALTLPQGRPLAVLGRVVHVTQDSNDPRKPARRYGLRFIGLERQAAAAITAYIWQRLQETYAAT